jgi:hypothetical protein
MNRIFFLTIVFMIGDLYDAQKLMQALMLAMLLVWACQY